MNSFGDAWIPSFLAKNMVIDPPILVMVKMGLGYPETDLRGFIQFSSQPETAIPVFFKNLRPLVGFQGDPVGTGKTGWNKTDVTRPQFCSPINVALMDIIRERNKLSKKKKCHRKPPFFSITRGDLKTVTWF